MKKALLLACAACITLSVSAQIPNAGFESWTSSGGANNPDGWGTLNPMTASMSTFTAMQGTPGNPGSAYLKLVTKNVTGMGVMPGIAGTGQINMTTMSIAGGFPMTTRPQSLTGTWQYMASGSDQGFIAVYLTKWNATTKMRDTVASTMNMLSGMAMSWATFSKNLTYAKGFNPDSALIVMSSSGLMPVAGSYLYVDNLAFAGIVATTAVGNTSSFTNGISLFPNPATITATLSFNSLIAKTISIQVSDVTGKSISVVTKEAAKGQNSFTIDTHAFAKGTYMIRLNDGTDVVSGKIVVE